MGRLTFENSGQKHQHLPCKSGGKEAHKDFTSVAKLIRYPRVCFFPPAEIFLPLTSPALVHTKEAGGRNEIELESNESTQNKQESKRRHYNCLHCDFHPASLSLIVRDLKVRCPKYTPAHPCLFLALPPHHPCRRFPAHNDHTSKHAFLLSCICVPLPLP